MIKTSTKFTTKLSLFVSVLMLLLSAKTAAAIEINDVTYYVLSESDATAYVGENYYLYGDIEIVPSFTFNGKTYTVTTIGWGAFQDCPYITGVTIPETVTTIDQLAFFHCTRLKSIVIPNSVTSLGGSAFSFCSSLTDVTISESLKTIEYSTFMYCEKLTEVTIPNSVTAIETNAFAYCPSLTTLNIGTEKYDNPLTISATAFSHSSLEIINSHNLTPPTVESEASFDEDTYLGKLHVYDEVYYDYKDAFVWEKFFSDEPEQDDDTTAVDHINIDINDGDAQYFTLSGVRLAQKPQTAGVYIIKTNNTTSKVVIR